MSDDDAKPFNGEIEFHYTKSPAFRSIAVHGIVGGLRPDGRGITFSLFNESAPLPTREVAPVVKGRLQKPTLREGPHGVIREVEVSGHMSIDTAEAVVAWLSERIKVSREALAALEKGKKGSK